MKAVSINTYIQKMNSEIQIFQNDLFGQVRTLLIDDEPWFVGKDVAKALGYLREADAIRARVDSDDKGVGVLPTPGGNQQVTIINESGLYSLTLSSKLPSAKKFKRWITSEVIPSIRKTGGYGIPKTFGEALRLAADQQLKIENQQAKLLAQQKQLEEQKPKVDFAETIVASDGSISVNDFAKILAQKGIDIGVNRLFKYLRNKEYFGLRGKYRNKPYQKYIDNGFFEIEESTYEKWVNVSVFITPKGQMTILQQILAEQSNNTLNRYLR